MLVGDGLLHPDNREDPLNAGDIRTDPFAARWKELPSQIEDEENTLATEVIKKYDY